MGWLEDVKGNRQVTTIPQDGGAVTPSLPPINFGDAGPSAAASGDSKSSGLTNVSVSTGGSKILWLLVIGTTLGAYLWFRKRK